MPGAGFYTAFNKDSAHDEKQFLIYGVISAKVVVWCKKNQPHGAG